PSCTTSFIHPEERPVTATMLVAIRGKKLSCSEWKASVPEELKRHVRFCGWLPEQNDKSPRNLRTGEHARTDDPATWGTFDEACEWYERHGGAGFVTGDGIGAFDID